MEGLGWHATTAEGGMFLDDRGRNRYSRKRTPIVAWLNCNGGVYSVNVVSNEFNLTQSIPASITSLEKAVDWVYHNSVWKGAAKNAKT